MKKLSILPAVFLFISNANAQNVGIGTPNPNKQLHIQGNGEILRIQGFQPWIGFMNNTDVDYKGFLFYPDTALVAGSAAASNQPIVLAPNNIGLLYANAMQRVGIGTAAPAEKLDVNGNINIAGNLRINNVAGQPNQVLMTNASGNTEWGSICDYKYYRMFYVSGSWIVPANVTKIMVEAWGGGGGGAEAGGGGSGSYCSNIFNVAPGQEIAFVVGDGGAGASISTGSGTAGGSTIVTVDGINFVAGGGNPASNQIPGTVSDAISGGLPSAPASQMFLPGNSGKPSTISYQQKSPTEFVKVTRFGDGGNPVTIDGANNNGGFTIINEATSAIIVNMKASGGSRFGGGGGGGNYTTFSGPFWGGPGGDGVVIIRW